MQAVWRARHVSSGSVRLVSLLPKTDDPVLVARIEQETQLLTKLPEIAIARFLEIVPHESGWALVADDDVDHSVRTFVDANGPVAPADAVRALTPVADALAATHNIKLVHGDITAVTVLVTSRGSCAIGQFGVSRYLRDSGSTSGASTRQAIRSSSMTAPEVERDERALPPTDVYGFGRVLLYLLSGDDALTEPLTLLSAGGLRPSSALVSVIEQCLRADPLDRPADGEALVRLLSETPEFTSEAVRLPMPTRLDARDPRGSGGQSKIAAAATSSKPTPGVGRRARFATAAIALIAVLAFVFAVFGAPTTPEDLGGPQSDPPPRPARPAAVSVPPVGTDQSLCSPDDDGRPVDASGRPVPESARSIEAELDGDGCPDHVRWWISDDVHGWRAHATLSTRENPVVLALGDPGDLLFFGAWNCNPTRTPALYRPRTGEVFTLTRWPGRVSDSILSRRGRWLSISSRPSQSMTRGATR